MSLSEYIMTISVMFVVVSYVVVSTENRMYNKIYQQLGLQIDV